MTRASTHALGALALASALAAGTQGCGGCPRSRGTHSASAHPAATDIAVEDAIVLEVIAGPPLSTELDSAGVHAVVVSQAADVRRCFEVARAEHPALAGEVELELEIAADGVVRAATLARNETGDGVLGACVLGLSYHWHFPASPHGAHVRVPFEAADAPPAPQAETAALEVHAD